jgi:hypothetical protein
LDKLRSVQISKDGSSMMWAELDEDLRVVDLLYPSEFAQRFH